MPIARKKTVLTALLAVWVAMGVLACSSATPLLEPARKVQLLPGDLQWIGNPKVHGLQTAALAGNPNHPGEPYTERIKLPANFRLPPHSHPNEARMVTVISGTLYFAFGDKFDEAQLKPFPPSSFFTEPKDAPHYALTREEVILQLNALGPAGTKYVEAQDAANVSGIK